MAISAADTPMTEDEMPATILALFDDPIDAEHALQSLRKGDLTASHVSLLVRNRGPADESVMHVARDIVAAALGAVANWLTGLAELILVEQGRFLVAGPMGAALGGAGRRHGAPVNRGLDANADADPEADRLHQVLTEFGFADTEASYVEQRLVAGTTLLAISTPQEAELAKARDVFHEQDAIFVSMAPTDSAFLAEIGSLIGAEPVSADTVVVADTVAPIDEADPGDAMDRWRGVAVVGHGANDAGVVDRVLVDDGPAGGASPRVPRYLVIAYGGMLGIGRHRVIVPVALVNLEREPIQVAASRELLHGAPAFDEAVPLTRRDEERVHEHFRLQPYWQASVSEDPGEGATNAGD